MSHGTIAIRSDLDNFSTYILTQFGVLNEMIFPELIYMFLDTGLTPSHMVHARGCKPESRL